MSTEIPTTEPERTWWLAGATSEARYRESQIRPEAKQVYHCVETMAELPGYGDDGQIAASLAEIFTVEWPMRRRLSVAWAIARPFDLRCRFKRWLRPQVLRLAKPGLMVTIGALAGIALWLVTGVKVS